MNTITLSRIADSLEAIKLLLQRMTEQTKSQTSLQSFDEFAQYYFNNFRWRKVSVQTKRNDLCRYNLHILPTLGDKPINRITPLDCQNLIDSLADYPKTSHEVFGLLNIIFKVAIRHGQITSNPCDMVMIMPYEKEHGHALTKEEETYLLSKTSGTVHQTMFAVALYTGLRPCEFSSARIENNFIIARNCKQKDGKEHKKKIPITPMLAPYVSETTFLHFNCPNRLRMKFKEILPNHKLYDLRTTFYTRCQECGVSEVARKLFVGHALGGLADTYTDVSDEYLIKEAQKLNY